VRTPAGLDIGARTAPEIAVSILAELVANRSSPATAAPDTGSGLAATDTGDSVLTAATRPFALIGLLTYNFPYAREVSMRVMSYSESRAKYAETLDSVVNDREEVVITRAGHEPVVMVSLDDYQSLKETAYLLRSPENAQRLITAIERLESGGGVQHELAE
jgi:antitoxin YefM